MKAKITIAILAIVLANLSFIVSIGAADDRDWAYASNYGNVPVILHVKIGENKYSEIPLEPGKLIILPAGSRKVTVFPAKAKLDKEDEMGVVTNLYLEDIKQQGNITEFKEQRTTITEPGKSVKFPRPSAAVTPQMRKNISKDVIFAPGALAEAEDKEEDKEEKEEAPIDDKKFLQEQNKMYMEKKERLQEIDPNGAEAEAIRDALKIWKEDLERMTKQAKDKYGPNWREHYRDSNGKLPGGFIEDDKSRLIKLKEKQAGQKEKVDALEKKFERLKKETRGADETCEERLLKDQREFRKRFIAEHGDPHTWDEETREKYAKEFNDLTEKSREQWEKDRDTKSAKMRELGRTIKELAKEKAELNSLDKKARQLEAKQKAKDTEQPADEKAEAKEDAEKDSREEEPAGQAPTAKGQEASDVPKNGSWRGWGGITIQDNKGTYKDTYGTGPGRFTFWKNEEGHYSGTWGESDQRFGTLEFKCTKGGTEINGSWKASDKCSIAPGNGGNIHWTFDSPTPDSPEEEARKPQLTLKPAIVRPGEKLTVTYKNAPGHDSDWINLAEVSWPAEQIGEYHYLRGHKEGTLTFTAPEAGTFEARLYKNWPFGGHEIVAKSNTIKAVLPGGKDLILRPTRVQTGEPVILSFAGMTDNQNDWVTLVKVTAPEQEYQQTYHLKEGQTQGTFRFTAPEPGEYEVRLLKVTENKIVGRSNPVTVVEKKQIKEEAKKDEKFILRVTTKTANNELADMDGDMHVYVTINGEGEHGHELDDPEDDFEPGAVDVFDREFNYPLAEVKFILLDAEGSDEWQCESISFQFLQGDKKSQVYTFNINTWFSTEQSDIEKLGAVKTRRFDIRPSADDLLKKK